MKKNKRQRNKKKFSSGPSRGKSTRMTVKVKPKEDESCHTRNPQPKVRVPIG